jgi:hypothetical protein
LCVFYLIHRPTSQHTHTLAPAAFPLFLTHTHTKSKKKMISGFCANCVTHKSEAWPPVKILWGPCNLVKKKLFWFFEVVCVRVWETLFFVFNFFNFSWATLKIYFFFPFQNEIQK